VTAQLDREPPPPPEAPTPVLVPVRGVPGWVRVATANVTWILLVLVGLVVFFTLAQPSFLTPFNIRSVFADNAALIVLAVGMTFVIVTAGIDLSVGMVLISSGVIAGRVMLALGSGSSPVGAENAGWPAVIAGILAGIATGLGWGLLNGLLVARAKVPPLIVTLGTFGMAYGSSLLLTNGTDLRGIPTSLTSSIGFGALFDQVPYLLVIAAVVVLALGLVLAYTRFGRYTYAIGSNQEAARRVGIDVDRHLVKVYALMGGLAGVAGCMNLAHFTTTTIGGHTFDNLSAISAAVIGGTSLFGGRGTVAGTVIGVLIPATLQSGFVIIGVQPYWQYVALGVVLVGAVYLDQVRRRTRERG
jgi:ribose transport system permease protein